jgi:hypothetical protein
MIQPKIRYPAVNSKVGMYPEDVLPWHPQPMEVTTFCSGAAAVLLGAFAYTALRVAGRLHDEHTTTSNQTV